MSTPQAVHPLEPGPALTAAVWKALRDDAARIAETEELLAPVVTDLILGRADFSESLAAVLARRLAGGDLSESQRLSLARETFATFDSIVDAAAADLAASIERNPAYPDAVTPFCYAKGFHALEWYRIAHALYNGGRRALAFAIQGRSNDAFSIDINPAAKVGVRVFIDHGTGVVIGETAVVGDDVSILHGVTLGGSGKESGDRHPKVAAGVLLSAGAEVIGNITIGEGAKIGAGSVVLKAVAPHTTVAGVPAKVVGRTRDEHPSETMDMSLDFQI